MSKDDDKSPEFTPSILHNRRGPLQSQRARALTLLPRSLAEFLLDRRVQALLCVFLPPGAVFLQAGVSRKFALSIFLSLFVFPGIAFFFLEDTGNHVNLFLF
jgi:uncharacterized membrane protein YqaE (UPF0057 family)